LRITSACFARSQARGLLTNHYSTWLIQLSYLGGYTLQDTRMMAFANTEDPWIDYLIISRLGGCYATPIIQFFQDRRFIIKIDPQLESATQPKARGLLNMEYDFAIALPYNLNFKTDELDHLPASRHFKLLKTSPSSTRGCSRTTRRGFKTTRTITLDYNVLGGLSGILPGYSCEEGGRVENGLLLEFPCTHTRTRSV
jgi:hypothetical protein